MIRVISRFRQIFLLLLDFLTYRNVFVDMISNCRYHRQTLSFVILRFLEVLVQLSQIQVITTKCLI